ncbi:hypothetical protein K438DRAFT_1909944 [Mycena galopus ATCC 62051]|nr:hypothetical protein K438DRAFT_1909944 [Mycena galopus ATCC 62051]
MASNAEDPTTAGVVRADNARLAHEIGNYAEVTHDAAQADRVEHTMSIRDAFRTHRKAVFWSMVLSAALIMEGYDVVVIAAFYEQPAFLRRFGVVNPASGELVISAPRQSGLGNGSSAGGIIGLLINGWASEMFGPRRTYIVSIQTLVQLTASEIICGLFWGGAYAHLLSAITLLRMCFILVLFPLFIFLFPGSYINMCWGIGIFLSSGVGWHEDAEESVMRLTDCSPKKMRSVIHTTAIEREMQAGTSYAMMVFAMQLLSGGNLVGQGVQLFKKAGLGTVASYDVSLALNSMFIIDTVASWFLLSRFRRRTLYLSGLATMTTFLLVIDTFGFSHADDAQWAVGGLLVVLSFVYNATLGAVCYVIIAEVGSTRLRAKNNVLARCAYQAMNIICGIITPLMLSPTSWNWGPKSGFF